MQQTVIKFPALSFKKNDIPSENENQKNYTVVLNVRRMPKELENWMDVNPRHQKVTAPAKAILETLQNSPETFVHKNRGLFVLAYDVQFNNKNNEVEIIFTEPELHGVADGGHTYRMIMNFLNEMNDESTYSDTFVKIDLLTGIESRDEVIDIVEARNLSTHVTEDALMNMAHAFEDIKLILRSQLNYGGKIAYKQFEQDKEGYLKPIPVRDILALLVAMNTSDFSIDSPPVFAYSSKSKVISYYGEEKHQKEIKAFLNLLPDIINFYEKIQLEFPKLCAVVGRKTASLPGVTVPKTKFTLPFNDEEMKYRIPSGYIYPILSAFRFAITKDGKWKTDPEKLFDKVKNAMIKDILERVEILKNPNALGKDAVLWKLCSYIVRDALD